MARISPLPSSGVLAALGGLLIAGCACCPPPPSPKPIATRQRIVGGIAIPIAGEDLSLEELETDAQALEVARVIDVLGCANVLRVARIPFRFDFEVSMGGATFYVFVPPEKAELARTALSRWAACPGYRCQISRGDGRSR
jgi:hypothetical protein